MSNIVSRMRVNPDNKEWLLQGPRAREVSKFVAEGDRTAYNSTIGTRLNTTQANNLWNGLEAERLRLINEEHKRSAGRAYKKDDAVFRGMMAEGGRNSRKMEEYGIGGAQSAFIFGVYQEVKKNNPDADQKVMQQDIWRAAAESRQFSNDALLEVSDAWKLDAQPAPSDLANRKSPAEISWVQAVLSDAISRNLDDIRKLREKGTKDPDIKKSEEYMGLARLAGGIKQANKGLSALAKAGDITDGYVNDVIAAELAKHSMLATKLHNHDLGIRLERAA